MESNLTKCTKCGKVEENEMYMHHYPFHKFNLCRNCECKLSNLRFPLLDKLYKEFIQPERLNPETPKGDAIV